MNTAALIVELVLTGLLMLTALLMPAFAGKALSVNASTAPQLLTLAIAVGFMLGVVVDRCADTLLARWEGRARCIFAWERDVPDQRQAMVKGGDHVHDPFPEDWMRIQMMHTAKDGVLRWMEQLRVRVRISRTVLILTPALTTSAIIALWATTGSPLAFVFSGLHILFLLVASSVAQWKRLAPPKTRECSDKPDDKTKRGWLWRSPAILWFGLQLLTAIVASVFAVLAGIQSVKAIGIAIIGAALTLLAVLAWVRISGTFMGFLWNFCRYHCDKELREACLGFPSRAAITPPQA
jgi:hypothetical protein